MSRSRNQHHPASHNSKLPSPFLDKEGKIPRRRKHIPYGSIRNVGYGGETYFKKWGEICLDVVNKKEQEMTGKKNLANFVIDYYVVLSSETLYNKQIKVKNKDSELIAKCSLEDYLKRKYGNSFKQLVITKCEEDIMSVFNSFFEEFK